MTGKQANIDEFSEKPDGSKKVRLKHLARINPTKSELSEIDPETRVSFIPLDDFGTDGEIKDTETKRLEDVYDGYTYFREGDIAIAKITPSFENGKGAICRGLENDIGFGTTELHVLRPREGVSTEFLWYVLRSKPFIDEAETAMRGVAGQQRVPTEFLENFRTWSPNPNEMELIAEYLNERCSEIDKLLATQNILKQRLLERRKSVISTTVLNREERGESVDNIEDFINQNVPDHWGQGKLKWLTKKIGSGVTPDGGSESYVDEGITFIRSQNVTDRGLDLEDVAYIEEDIHKEMSATHLQAGDVLLNITGASLGRSSLVTEDVPPANVNQHVCIIRPKSDVFLPPYLNYVIASPVVQRQIFANQTGASRDAITFSQLGDFRVPIPPIKEQKQIIQRINKQTEEIDRLASKIDRGVEVSHEKRQALITTAVTGQIDMSEVQGES